MSGQARADTIQRRCVGGLEGDLAELTSMVLRRLQRQDEKIAGLRAENDRLQVELAGFRRLATTLGQAGDAIALVAEDTVPPDFTPPGGTPAVA
jgi:phage-related minor tail protein